MNLARTSKRCTASTELQRNAVECKRNQKRLERYRHIRMYLYAVQIVESLNRAR